MPGRGVERWLSQRLSHVLGRGEQRRRRMRGGLVPQPGIADRRDHSASSTTTRGRPTLWHGRCWRSSTPPRSSLVRHPGNASGPLRHGRRGRAAAGPAVCRRATHRRTLRLLRAGSVRNCSSTGWSATTKASTPKIWPGNPHSGGRFAARRRRSAAHPPSEDPCTAARRTDRPASAAVAVRAHPPAVHRYRAAAAHWPPTTPCTCGCRIPATTCGGRCPTRTGPSHAARTPATTMCDHPLLPRSAATCASSNAASPPTCRLTNILAAPTNPAHSWAGCRPTSAPTPFVHGRVCWPRMTGPCRCTAATARPGRLRCCARCCSGCSPTTRHWSRATSW